MRSHLFILSFMSLALGDILVKMLLSGMSEIFLPMFSSRTFMVLRLIFKSFIHLELIFVYGISWWSSFIFWHVAVQISQHHLLKRIFLLHFMSCLLCPILIDFRDLGLLLVSLFCSIGLCSNTRKVLEENIGRKISDIPLSNILTDTSLEQAT